MLNICIGGKNQIAVNALSYLLSDLSFAKANIHVCPNKNDLGIDTWQPSLIAFAEKQNIRIVDLEEVYDLQDLIFISLEFDRIIKPNRFKTERLFNIHFSLLPKYKGVYTSVFPILFGEEYSGVTLHKIDPGIDTGDILAQKQFKIGINETARDLYFKYLNFGFGLFKENIIRIINNQFSSNPQASLNSSYYSRQDIDLNNISIDFNKTSFQIHNQIRAFIFEEYQLPVIKNYKIKNSELTPIKIEKNFYSKIENEIIISGIDGYKIILNTDD